MSDRQTLSTKKLVAVAIKQAGGILCPLCSFYMFDDSERVLEHMTPLKLGGSNELENLRWVHAACAKAKTNGTPATVASGDLHKIAKARRLAEAQKIHKAVLNGETKRQKSRIPSRPFARKNVRP